MERKEWCPGLKEDAHDAALELAWENLARTELKRAVGNAGAGLVDGKVVVRTFGRDCVVDPSTKSVAIRDKELSPLASILVLHYLAGAADVTPTGKWVSYRQVPGGSVYYPAFKQRVIDQIGSLFHSRPQLLLSAMDVLEAKKLDFGEASVQIDVFPKLPVAVIIWKGDDEVRGTANVLFDETAPSFMATEDLASVGSFVLNQLIKARELMLREVNNRNTV